METRIRSGGSSPVANSNAASPAPMASAPAAGGLAGSQPPAAGEDAAALTGAGVVNGGWCRSLALMIWKTMQGRHLLG